MGPKKKVKGKRGARKPLMMDGMSTDEMTKEQLEDHVIQLREELDRERKERNYFQVENNKLYQFWEISKKEVESKSAEVRNKENIMEEEEEKHQQELKIYKQKVKHLMYEYQNNLSELKGETVAKLNLTEDDHRAEERELFIEKKDLKYRLKEQELLHEINIKKLLMKNEDFVSNLRMNMSNDAREEKNKYEKKMVVLREELDLRRKTEIHEIEERKSQQINALIKNHEKAFTEIKNYYNDIILNNLALINTLKEQIEEVRRKEEYTIKSLHEATIENRKCSSNLQKSKEEIQDLHKKLESYDKDKMFLKNCKGKLKELTVDITNMNWEHKLLEQRYEKVESERDEIYKKFVEAIHEVHQKSNLKNLILEKKLSKMAKVLQKKESRLTEVIALSRLDPVAADVIGKQLEEMMESKNNAIQDLQYELSRVCKAHNDIIRTYETKLQEYSVPISVLGFEPLHITVAGKRLGKGTAGLVSQPVI